MLPKDLSRTRSFAGSFTKRTTLAVLLTFFAVFYKDLDKGNLQNYPRNPRYLFLLFCATLFGFSGRDIFYVVVPESACEGFFVKKQPLYYIFTPSYLLIYIFTPSHLLIYIFTPLHLQIYIFTPSHLQI